MTLSSLEARRIIAQHQHSAPVPVLPIASDLGVNVYRALDWPDDVSGMIVRDEQRGGSSGYSIYVNAHHADVRRRFTIAHELAHFVLHKSLIGDGIKDDGLYRSGLSSAIEAEANRFAADILMPDALVRQKVAEGITSVDALAKAFGVSKSSMSIKLGVPFFETAPA